VQSHDSGDPKTENLIYHLDTRTFDYQDEDDLSVIHIRCDMPPTDDQWPYNYRKAQSYITGYNSPTYDAHYSSDDATDAYSSGFNDAQFEINHPRVDSPSLGDTDFEQDLHIIFQLSDQPRQFDAWSMSQWVNKFNYNFMWSRVGDRSMSDEQVKYQDYTAASAQRAYRKLYAQYENGYLVPGTFNHTLTEAEEATVQSEEYKYAGPWFGEVGRMLFQRFQATPRDFMWTSYYGKQLPSDRKDPDVRETLARKASYLGHTTSCINS